MFGSGPVPRAQLITETERYLTLASDDAIAPA
ncbi:hypothetical protein BH20ACI3_BH20ACI3_05000 [soil metagenome]